MKTRKFNDEHEKIQMHIVFVLPPSYRFESRQDISDQITDEGNETQSQDEKTDGIPETDIVLL